MWIWKIVCYWHVGEFKEMSATFKIKFANIFYLNTDPRRRQKT